jgi:EmrB/QacA subfamily drug resistance transporter
MPTAANRRLTVVALVLSTFLAAMESTVVSTAMPTVIGELGGVSLYAWIFTAYMLTSTITVPIYGKLSDQYGRKPILLLGLFLFLAGSALCGAARSVEALIAFRAVQGLGAGSVQTTATTIVGDLYTLKERGRVQGAFSAVWGLAGVAGPMLGALIVSATSWRWIFFVNLPFGLGATAILVWFYAEKLERKAQRLDWLGALTLTLGVLALLAATGGDHAAPYAAAAAALLAGFVAHERRTPDALLPLDLFEQRLMAVACVLSALVGATMYATTTYLPLYVQGATHGTAAEAGGLLTPMLVAWPIAATFAGRTVTRFGYWPLVALGSVAATVGTLVLALAVQLQWPLVALYVASGLIGAGLGFVSLSTLLAVQTNVAWQRRGVATASTMFFRIIGGTLAIGFLGAYVTRGLTAEAGFSRASIEALLGPDGGKALAPELVVALSAKMRAALVPIFWIVCGFGVAFTLAGALFPRRGTVGPTAAAPVPPAMH